MTSDPATPSVPVPRSKGTIIPTVDALPPTVLLYRVKLKTDHDWRQVERLSARVVDRESATGQWTAGRQILLRRVAGDKARFRLAICPKENIIASGILTERSLGKVLDGMRGYEMAPEAAVANYRFEHLAFYQAPETTASDQLSPTGQSTEVVTIQEDALLNISRATLVLILDNDDRVEGKDASSKNTHQ